MLVPLDSKINDLFYQKDFECINKIEIETKCRIIKNKL